MQMSISTKDFIQFLVQAKRQTYAAQDNSANVTPLLPGSRQLEYRAGNWLYRDIYFGGIYFVGQETIYESDAPVWAMSYAGGIVLSATPSPEIGPVYSFLKTALRQVAPECPYRGPAQVREGAFVYTDAHQGDVERFEGLETIKHSGVLIYQLRYNGGLLR